MSKSTNKFATAVAVVAFSLSVYGCSSGSNYLSFADIAAASVEPSEIDQAREKVEADANSVRMAREAVEQRAAEALAATTTAEQARIAADAARDETDRLLLSAAEAEGVPSPAAVRLRLMAEAAEKNASAAEVKAEAASEVLRMAEEALVSALAALAEALAASVHTQETLAALADAQAALANAQQTLAALRMAEWIAEKREREIRDAQRLAGLEGGLAASPASPVYAARDEDTLASLLPGGEVLFAPLSAALLIDSLGNDRGVREPDLGAAYVEAVSGDGAGGFRVNYVIDGIETPVHFGTDQFGYYYGGDWNAFYFSDAETTEDDEYQLWPDIGSFDTGPEDQTATRRNTDRNDGSSEFTYLDINAWHDNRGGASLRGYSTYGVRTRPENLPLGSATYEGRMQAEIWDSHAPNLDNQTLIRGAVTLEANLDAHEISGRIDEIYTRPAWAYGSEYKPLTGGNSIDISSTTIDEGRFTAHWIGNDLDANAANRDTVRGFEGMMLGEFYGPTAEEAGGVLSGRREATDFTPEQYLIGGFGTAISVDDRGPTPGASGVADAIDLASNTGRMDNLERVGGWTRHFDWYPASGSQYASVSQSHRDGGAAAAVPWRDDYGELEFHIDVVPHGEPLQRDPDVLPGRYISTSDIIKERDGLTTSIRSIADHGLGVGWQAFEARQKYDGGGILTVNFRTDVEVFDMLEEPWVGNDEEFDRTIFLDDVPTTPTDQDYQIVLVPEGGVTGSLDGKQGRFTCNSCTLAIDPRAGPAGYYPLSGNVSFAPDDGSAPVVLSASHSEEVATADYLSLGNWLYVPEDVTDLDAYAFGVFAGGGDPFEMTRLMALAGTASYAGEATGMYYTEKSSSRPHIGSFDADVELMADFGTGSEFGTIGGKVYNFEFDSDASSFPTEVRLETASWRNTEGTNIFQSAHEGDGPVPGGWILGDASGSMGDTSWWGVWSGKFFGNGIATTDIPDFDASHPSSVSGTFGATNDESGLAGSFGAYLVEQWSLPFAHGLSVGQFTVEPGAIEEHGNIVVSCPSGGKACMMTVAQDGTAVYEKRGGAPVVLLALPEEFYAHFTQAPTVNLDDTLHIGADAALPADQFTAAGMHNHVAVSHGTARDGLGADEVFAYLKHYVNLGQHKHAPGLETFSVQPTVRLAEGTSSVFVDLTLRAVQLINAALPHDKRIAFSNDFAPPLVYREDVPDGEIFIDFVPWEDWNEPQKPPRGTAAGISASSPVSKFNGQTGQWEVQEMRAGRIWIDRDEMLTAWVVKPDTGQWDETILESYVDDTDARRKKYSEQDVTSVLVHELIHALGMRNHADPARFPNSIMNIQREDYGGVPGHVLYPVDREAVQAAYRVLEPGTLPDDFSLESLGTWDDISVHVRGDFDTLGGPVSFGVTARNGLAQPWAFGPMPQTSLADNQMLSETVTWAGRLLGFTPIVQVVGGAADLGVDLGTLDGELDFTDLEHWESNAAPGAIGTGTIWGDGDLGYTISVRGNTFVQTGGDEGVVTGAFFGASHEAMGGVVERTDLTASFGGTR